MGLSVKSVLAVTVLLPLALLSISVSLLWILSDPQPQSRVPSVNLGMFGVYAVNDRLQRLLADGVGMGSEDLAFDEDGFLYSGYENGQILRIDPVTS